MSHVIAIANQKGGVGKTTTAINLGASLAVAEKRTLVLVIDPQGNATSGLGLEDRSSWPTIYYVLIGQNDIADAVVEHVHFPYLDVVPSTRDLVGAEIELVSAFSRETILRQALETVRDQYDFILVDCPPSLGLLTINTLTAADSVLIPIQCEFYALQGLSELVNTINQIQSKSNNDLKIEGILRTMFDSRNNLSSDVSDQLKQYFPNELYKTKIPRNIRVAEAPSFGQSILEYDGLSKGSLSYLSLAGEIIKDE